MVNKVDCIDDFNDKIESFNVLNNSEQTTYNQRVKALNELHQVLQRYNHGRPLMRLAPHAANLDAYLKSLTFDPRYLPILEEVTRVRKAITPYFSIKLRQPIELKIGLFCDFDAPDDNGVIALSMVNYFENMQPIITRKSLLKKLSTVQRNFLFESQHEWDFFKHDNSDLVLFLPKNLKPELELDHKLVDLDFDPHVLEKTSLAMLLGSRPSKASVENLQSLFLPDPHVDKLFYLAGHGGTDAVGGMIGGNYTNFLMFLEAQKCKGLVITSCFSGGKNNLKTLRGHTFTTLVRSTGDFVVEVGDPGEFRSAEFNEAFARLLSEGSQTIASYRKMVEKVEQKPTKFFGNYYQIVFPHSPIAPTGFRPLLEHGIHDIINNVRLKVAEVSQEPYIEVEDKSLLGIYPLVINTKLYFSDQSPLLISMVPGPSHHFMKGAILQDFSPVAFIQKIVNAHSEIEDPKMFFIDEIMYSDEQWTHVALLLTSTGFEVVYAKNGKYFYQNGTERNEITWVAHAQKVAEMERMTIPSSEAVRVSSGGQESKDDFKTAMEDFYWSEGARNVVQSLTHHYASIEVKVEIGHENVFQVIQDLIDHFGDDTNPKKVWIDEIHHAKYVLDNLVILLTKKGLAVYRAGSEYHLYDGANLHRIEKQEYLLTARDMFKK